MAASMGAAATNSGSPGEQLDDTSVVKGADEEPDAPVDYETVIVGRRPSVMELPSLDIIQPQALPRFF